MTHIKFSVPLASTAKDSKASLAFGDALIAITKAKVYYRIGITTDFLPFRLQEDFQKALMIEVITTFLWSDRTTVLRWLVSKQTSTISIF